VYALSDFQVTIDSKQFFFTIDSENKEFRRELTIIEMPYQIEFPIIYLADGNSGLKRYIYGKGNLNNLETFGYVSDVIQKKHLAYVADNDLTIVDTNSSTILEQVETPDKSKVVDIIDDKIYVLSQKHLSIVSESTEVDFLFYTNTQLSLRILSPKYSGSYHIKIYNSTNIIANIPIIFIPPFNISHIEDQIISPSIKQAIFPFTLMNTLPEEKIQNYTMTGLSGIPFLLPDDQVTIEGDGIKRKISVQIPTHLYGSIPIHIEVNNDFTSIMNSFNLTIKYPQIFYNYDGTLSFSIPQSISAVSNNFLFQVRKDENCIIKENMNNEEILQWGQEGTDNGSFNQPTGIAIDSDGFIYVADTGNHRIQVFTVFGEFITSFGEYGFGQLHRPTYISIDENDTIYVAEEDSNVINKFQKNDYTEGLTKAIIVAGGGPYTGNTMWKATKTCANLAYRSLIYQGLNKEHIQYLSSEPKDKNNFVDCPASISNIEHAITQWAAGNADDALKADSLVIYMVDHGGEGLFKVNESEYLSATILTHWLDEIQEHIPGKLIVIYDACSSGSFMKYWSTIPKNRERIVITSSYSEEPALFTGDGALSFSSYFWAAIFNGMDIKDAFLSAQKISDFKYNNVPIFPQHPQVNVNGNTINNEPVDINALQNVIIGNGTGLNFDLPFIQEVSPEKCISDSTSAEITATGIWAKDEISSVWAQIMPLEYTQSAINKAVIELPSVELIQTNDNVYKGIFHDFTHEGTYLIAVYAKDINGFVSYPRLTTVIVQKPLKRSAIILMGKSGVDSLTAVKSNGEFSVNALKTQAYFDDDIVKIDGESASAEYLGSVINDCIEGQVKDIVLYMIGDGDDTHFFLSDSEPAKTLSQSDIKTILDSIPNNISVSIIYDAPYSNKFLEGLKPDSEIDRILLSSTSSENSFSKLDGMLSFSRFFWNMVFNGGTLWNSYLYASNCIKTIFNRQQIPNMVYGSQRARNYKLGYGIMFGDDFPVITSVSVGIDPCEKTLSIKATNVSSTRSIETVVAFVFTPDHFQTKNNSTMIVMDRIPGSNNYSGRYDNCSRIGQYDISICAIDSAGNISYPKTTTVQSSDIYHMVSALQFLSGSTDSTFDIESIDINKDKRLDLKDVISMMGCL